MVRNGPHGPHLPTAASADHPEPIPKRNGEMIDRRNEVSESLARYVRPTVCATMAQNGTYRR
jgi:hypothetical protein